MVRHSFFQHSLCLNKFLHTFDIVEEYPDGVVEVCQRCKKKKFFKVIDDKLNNADYMSWHFGHILPQNHPFYYHQFKYEPFASGVLSPFQL